MRLKLKVCEFGDIFGMFFHHAQLPPIDDAPILSQNKVLMEIHNRGKFHEYTICDCQVINVQMFSHHQKRPFLGHFG